MRQRVGPQPVSRHIEKRPWSDFTRTTDVDQPLLGNFPYYSDGVAGEKYGTGNYKATNGRLYKVTSGAGTPLAWYPAPGCRNNASGTQYNINNGGYSWASIGSGINGMTLYFGVTWLLPSSAGGRGSGFQLRCLSE